MPQGAPPTRPKCTLFPRTRWSAGARCASAAARKSPAPSPTGDADETALMIKDCLNAPRFDDDSMRMMTVLVAVNKLAYPSLKIHSVVASTMQ